MLQCCAKTILCKNQKKKSENIVADLLVKLFFFFFTAKQVFCVVFTNKYFLNKLPNIFFWQKKADSNQSVKFYSFQKRNQLMFSI